MKLLPYLPLALLALLPTITAAEPPAADGLPSALRATLANHPALAGKRAELAALGYVVESQRARWYPNLSGQAGYASEQHTLANVSLEQPLWAFGKINNPIAQAEADAKAEKLALLQLQRRLLEDTAAAYGQALGLRQGLLIADDDRQAHQTLYAHIRKRQRGQLASESDVNLARARLLQADARQAALRSELQVALRELQALTQSPNAVTLPVTDDTPALPDTTALQQQVVEDAAEARYKRARIAVAQRAVDTARSANMPTLSVRATHTYRDQYTGRNDNQVSVVLAGSLDGLGRVSAGRVSEARAREEAARQDLYTTLNELRRRVATLTETRAMQDALVRAREASVASVKATLDSYFRQYRSGHKTWLEVLNMRRELTEQRLQLVQARSDRRDATLRLLALSGALDGPAGLVTRGD